MTQISIGSKIGPYAILRQIGAGGMGEVYEAVHEAIERHVAIKVLHPEYAKNPDVAARFFNEARAVNRVQHPGMVQVSDLGQMPDGTAYLVMELLLGETLKGVLKQAVGPLPVPQTLDLCGQIAAALSAAHAKNIIHRDIKPENVMIIDDPLAPRGKRVKILDFGIAKLAEANGMSSGGTSPGLLIGTPKYMSPEQCRGIAKIDAKADVYSLGVILYQALSGDAPFDSSSPGELIIMHSTVEPKPLRRMAPQVPSPLADLVDSALAKAPEKRPSMPEMAQKLSEMLRRFENSTEVSAGLDDDDDDDSPKTKPMETEQLENLLRDLKAKKAGQPPPPAAALGAPKTPLPVAANSAPTRTPPAIPPANNKAMPGAPPAAPLAHPPSASDTVPKVSPSNTPQPGSSEPKAAPVAAPSASGTVPKVAAAVAPSASGKEPKISPTSSPPASAAASSSFGSVPPSANPAASGSVASLVTTAPMMPLAKEMSGPTKSPSNSGAGSTLRQLTGQQATKDSPRRRILVFLPMVLGLIVGGILAEKLLPGVLTKKPPPAAVKPVVESPPPPAPTPAPAVENPTPTEPEEAAPEDPTAPSPTKPGSKPGAAPKPGKPAAPKPAAPKPGKPAAPKVAKPVKRPLPGKKKPTDDDDDSGPPKRIF